MRAPFNCRNSRTFLRIVAVPPKLKELPTAQDIALRSFRDAAGPGPGRARDQSRATVTRADGADFFRWTA